jgi:hypothetical protein
MAEDVMLREIRAELGAVRDEISDLRGKVSGISLKLAEDVSILKAQMEQVEDQQKRMIERVGKLEEAPRGHMKSSPRDEHVTGSWPFGLLVVLIPLGLILPGLVWSLFNQAPFSGDDSVYARASLELFRTLLESPLEWPRRSMDILPLKPNALIWIGQGFVPAAYLLGSVNKSLLLSVWITQLLTVIIMYRAMIEFSERDLSTAVLGSLIIASAPLFVMFGGYYLVEAIQTLAVAWFILIMARADRWDPAYTLCHLLAATAFALLTKTTTPLFCVWPGLIALASAVRRSTAPDAWRWRQPRIAAMAIVSLCVAAVAVTWYYWNWAPVVAHAKIAATGPIAAVWGKEDTVLNTLWFWLQEVARSFLLLSLGGLSLAALFVVAVCSRKRRSAKFDAANLVALLQMATVLGAFSLSANRSTRCLLLHFPMWPSSCAGVFIDSRAAPSPRSRRRASVCNC